MTSILFVGDEDHANNVEGVSILSSSSQWSDS